ncbi:FOG: EAL domain|uniref:EAL domain-containing protein n=2 Tax=Brenneria salicis TaxID=55214 RepID=A0A366I3I3_9GAMM|nr:EAL domain-containing protein [Brenneria salicis]NMN92725.1 FOG: EAL domain [Brenneria salicis ATCC 15712 = DSM 30166]RBP62435.1 EAL domain-containing protein [Brenneria salicis ATCC 15712 = DSM 30166]
MMIVDPIPEAKRRYVMEPIHNSQNILFAMELLTRFGEDLCTEEHIRQMSVDDKQQLLIDQLECVTEKKAYFINNNILLSINLDFSMALFLFQDRYTENLLDNLSFVHLEINEGFPNLNDGKRDPLLSTLYNRYPLWLDDFGRGNANIYAVSQSLFHYVKLDKLFYWEMIRKRKAHLLPALISNIKRYCHGVIIKGVQNQSEYFLLKNCGVDGIQGHIYTTYELEHLPM